MYPTVNKNYAYPYTRLSVPLAEDEHQYVPNQLSLHMNNITNDGKVEIVSDETGKNVTQYFKYIPDRSSVTVSNDTMNVTFAIKVPNPNDPTIVKVNSINLDDLYVLDIRKNNATNTNPASITYSYYRPYPIPISFGNSTYDGMVIRVSIPNDRVHYMPLMFMYIYPYICHLERPLC